MVNCSPICKRHCENCNGRHKYALNREQKQVYTVCFEVFYIPKYRSIACACCYSHIPAVADNPLLVLIL